MIRMLLLASVVLAVPAAAQETAATAAAKFHREFVATDTNKDGAWTIDEVEARTTRMRPAAKGSDLQLGKKLAALWFSRADANKNGKVTEYEAQKLLAATFREYDANGDGKIGGQERAAAKKAIQKGR